MDFFISQTNPDFFYIKKFILWYQKIEFVISQNLRDFVISQNNLDFFKSLL